MTKTILELIFCHLIGDYILQSDYIARTKGDNWYHLLVHCVLYCVPFYVVFGLTCQLPIVFATHVLIDALKARYKKINYTTDQILHYIVMCLYLFERS